MKILQSCLVYILIILFFQACAMKQQDDAKLKNAKLVRMGDGICLQDGKLMWQSERGHKVSTWQEARSYAKSLKLGSYSDWRLPSKEELYDLSYIFEMNLAGNCDMNPDGSYWVENGEGGAGQWVTYPLCGGPEFKYIKSKEGYVRAVRP